ncbi:MAG: hypothetical protein IJF48_01465 [Clostridia bacterium]|nr:hypothetical protein [Clostridia bacterium]
MKHFFIINPAAGKGIESSPLLAAIKDACEVSSADYEIYITAKRGDATVYVRNKIKEKPQGQTWRFYACGGDGTLSEVVSGAANSNADAVCGAIPGIEVGCIPIGTGNDFVRNFTSPEFFCDITKQLLADTIEIDCYSCGANRYGVNMINIGFDCDVVVKAAEFKKRRFMPKSLAYIAGVVALLRDNPGRVIHVRRADGSEVTKEFQLVSAANGGWCGGGFHSAPKSALNDGLLDVSLIDKVSRRDFIRLVGSYKSGKHLETKLGKKIVEYTHAKAVSFEFAEPTNVCIDGEISVMDKLEVSIAPRAIAFAVPVGCRVK